MKWVWDTKIRYNKIRVRGGKTFDWVVDENGSILKYRQRTRHEDGSWVWKDVDPNIPANYEAVPGLKGIYKVTEPDGSIHYYKYTRNPDDTYFFTEVDEFGNPLVDSNPDNGEIPKNFVHVSGNIYAVYNKYGVLVGYKERIQNTDGSYTWVDADPPQSSSGNGQPMSGSGIPTGKQSGTGTQGGDIYIVTGSDDGETQKGYKEEETYTDTKQEGDWTVVYETIVTRTYNEAGDLISTKKDGPTEVNRFPTTDVNASILSGK